METESVPRTATKTTLVTFRITPETKALLLEAAAAERRSQANMFEVMVDAWCKERGISAAATKTAHKRAQKA